MDMCHLNKIPIALLTFFILLNCNAQKNKGNRAINRLENNLTPSVVLKKDSGQHYRIKDRLLFYNTPGASIVLFENQEIIDAKYYGYADASKKTPITETTKFQVASISKTVTAVAVLKLIELYQLNLDADVNLYLKSWKVPENEFTRLEKVTIRRLLNHTAGINIGGFTGYPRTENYPSVLDILNGKGATPAITVVQTPGSGFSYSGGGYLILAHLIEDVASKNFEAYMQEIIFGPLKMTNSSFKQNPTNPASLGYDQDGKPCDGGWRIMPELAPNGLWTTAVDLAKFCIAVQRAFRGEANTIITKTSVQSMLTSSPHMAYGLGVALKQDKENQFFFHAGQNPGGYSNMMINLLDKNKGVIILTNNEDVHLMREITNAYASMNSLGYARGFVGPQTVIKTIPVTTNELSEYGGDYADEGKRIVNVRAGNENNLLMKYFENDYVAVLSPIAKDKFFEVFTEQEIVFQRESKSGKIVSVTRRGRTFSK
jgi:CubicO group peptidase (beta-lactamase class C family)